MLKFHQIVLRKFILIFSILFFIVGAIVYYWSKEFYISQTKDSLLNNIEIISFELKENSNLDILASKIKKNLQLRLTVIAVDGIVRPLILSGTRPYRVVDGMRRLKFGRALEMQSVPAIVFGDMNRREIGKLRYVMETTSDRWAIAQQLRTLARLYRNGYGPEELSRLLRKKKRTIQRYLRIASHPDLVKQVERGELSLNEAEERIRNKRRELGSKTGT